MKDPCGFGAMTSTNLSYRENSELIRMNESEKRKKEPFYCFCIGLRLGEQGDQIKLKGGGLVCIDHLGALA